MTEMLSLADFRRNRGQRVFFNRHELRQLLDLYSRRVSSGEWKDYAIDQHGPMAVFSVFRHSFDQPAYAIAKRTNGRACDFLILRGRHTLKRGKTIGEALDFLEHQLRLV